MASIMIKEGAEEVHLVPHNTEQSYWTWAQFARDNRKHDGDPSKPYGKYGFVCFGLNCIK
jgi:hypothetical protein